MSNPNSQSNCQPDDEIIVTYPAAARPVIYSLLASRVRFHFNSTYDLFQVKYGLG